MVQSISAALFIVLAFFLVNPMEVWMPSSAHMAVLAAAVAAFGIFAVFVLRETTGDERENEHRSFAGRVAFLAGAGTLLLGVVLQTFAHTLDPWLVAALAVMVVAKVVAHVYSEKYR